MCCEILSHVLHGYNKEKDHSPRMYKNHRPIFDFQYYSIVVF